MNILASKRIQNWLKGELLCFVFGTGNVVLSCIVVHLPKRTNFNRSRASWIHWSKNNDWIEQLIVLRRENWSQNFKSPPSYGNSRSDRCTVCSWANWKNTVRNAALYFLKNFLKIIKWNNYGLVDGYYLSTNIYNLDLVYIVYICAQIILMWILQFAKCLFKSITWPSKM